MAYWARRRPAKAAPLLLAKLPAKTENRPFPYAAPCVRNAAAVLRSGVRAVEAPRRLWGFPQSLRRVYSLHGADGDVLPPRPHADPAICAIRILRKKQCGPRQMPRAAYSNLLDLRILRAKFLPRVPYGEDHESIRFDSIDHTVIPVDYLPQISTLRLRHTTAACRMAFQSLCGCKDSIHHIGGRPGMLTGDVFSDLDDPLQCERRPDELHRRKRARTSSLAASCSTPSPRAICSSATRMSSSTSARSTRRSYSFTSRRTAAPRPRWVSTIGRRVD
jgi:hypothetical protein